MMTSAEIRQSFLDFFKSKQHTIVPSSSLMPDSPEPAVHQRRHEPVRAHLPRPARASAPTRRGPAPPTPRSASAPAASTTTSKTSASTPTTTRSSRCSATGPSATTSRRRPSTGRGNWSPKSGSSPRTASTPRSIRPDKAKGDPSEFDQEAYDHWARDVPRRRPRPQGPHRQRQQERQLLDDGRHRPLRPVPRDPRGPHARRATPAARLVNQGDARVHRDLEPGLHPVQRQPGRHLLAAARQARGYRHGLRARHRHHPEHEGLHRLQPRSSPTTKPTSSARSSTRSRS